MTKRTKAILIFYMLLMIGEIYLIVASIYHYAIGETWEATYHMVVFIAIMAVRIYAKGGKE